MTAKYQEPDDMNFSFNHLLPSKRTFSDINDEHFLHTSTSGSISKIASLNSDFQSENQREKTRTGVPATSTNDHLDSSSSLLPIANNDHSQSAVPQDDQNNLQKQTFNDNQEMNGHSNFSEVLGELGQEAKMIMLQYSQTFTDSEVYEQQGLQAINELTAHASVLEQRLTLQKELLCNRLKIITQNLKSEI